MGLEPINLFLGKEAFYQLNYARKRNLLYVILKSCQPECNKKSRIYLCSFVFVLKIIIKLEKSIISLYTFYNKIKAIK